MTRQTVNDLLRERRALSSSMALRLARLFGTTAEYWLNLQRAVDLRDADALLGKDIRGITVLKVAEKMSSPPPVIDGCFGSACIILEIHAS